MAAWEPWSHARGRVPSGFRDAVRVGAQACALLLGVAILAATGGAVSAAPAREVYISDPADSGAAPGQGASEPVIATHPTDPQRIAVTYLRFSRTGWCSVVPAIRISRDGGWTWADVPSLPWAETGRCPGPHAAIAWGPGPAGKPARLYWVDTVSDRGGLRVGTAWSDDEGRSWSTLRVERRTPPWGGGFPDITVDRHPGSPNRGVVYVAYNWSGDPGRGPGVRVLASADYGRTWRAVEIGPVPGRAGYPDSWRVDTRVRAGPDGSAYVAFYQADLRAWDSSRIFSRGPWGNVGRVGFGVSRVTFDRATGRLQARRATMATILRLNAWTAYTAATPGTTDNLADPTWSLSLDVDPSTGRVLLAVGDYRGRASSTIPRGTIRVGRSDDRAATWTWTELAALPPAGGRPQSSFRPTLVSSCGVVVVGLRGITDAAGGRLTRAGPTIGAAYAVSADGGVTFDAPRAISPSRWSAASLARSMNGPGLRDRAALTAGGAVIYAWGDGRLARPAPDRRAGRVAIYGALIDDSGAGRDTAGADPACRAWRSTAGSTNR